MTGRDALETKVTERGDNVPAQDAGVVAPGAGAQAHGPAGIPAMTIARFALDGAVVPPHAVVVLDEISQVATADAEIVAAAVASSPGARLWCLGDPHQAQAVRAGERRYAAGDRVLIHGTLRANGQHLHNGTVVTVRAVMDNGLRTVDDHGQPVTLPLSFIEGHRTDGSPNCSHAWARTVDGIQGGTWPQGPLLGTATVPLPERGPDWNRDLNPANGLSERIGRALGQPLANDASKWWASRHPEIASPPLPGHDSGLGMDIGI